MADRADLLAALLAEIDAVHDGKPPEGMPEPVWRAIFKCLEADADPGEIVKWVLTRLEQGDGSAQQP
jgi:hypothetical protein